VPEEPFSVVVALFAVLIFWAIWGRDIARVLGWLP
jgi:hypothetical protein